MTFWNFMKTGDWDNDGGTGSDNIIDDFIRELTIGFGLARESDKQQYIDARREDIEGLGINTSGWSDNDVIAYYRENF